MEPHDKPIANPLVVLREEFDDWAILFDPDTGNAFGLNPTGVYLWKLLDGEHSIDEMLQSLRQEAEEVPEEAGDHHPGVHSGPDQARAGRTRTGRVR